MQLFKRIKALSLEGWMVVAMIVCGVIVITSASYLVHADMKAGMIATIQTKHGTVTKTYYGTLPHQEEQFDHDWLIAQAEIEGKTPAEIQAKIDAEGATWREAKGDFDTKMFFLIIVAISCCAMFIFPENHERNKE